MREETMREGSAEKWTRAAKWLWALISKILINKTSPPQELA